MEKIKKFIYTQVASKHLSKQEARELLQEVQEAAGNKMAKGNGIAIIGMACRFPGAKNTEEYWDILKNGRNCIGVFPESRRKDIDKYLPPGIVNRENAYKKGGYLENIDLFDAAFFRISPREAELMDPCQRLFLETAWEAIEDAGMGGRRLNGSRTGVYAGMDTSGGGRYINQIQEGSQTAVTGNTTSILASRLSYILDLKGPALVLDTACSSGLMAVHLAVCELLAGGVDMALAGGIALSYMPVGDSMLDSPDNVLRAFDRKAAGTVWGEGVGAVLLKPLDKAIEEKDHIYAVIRGSAANNDGVSNGLTAPNVYAQAYAIQAAWRMSNIDPRQVSYIETHGTGTKLGDPIETKGISMAFGKYTDKRQFCGIGSVKTNIGHLVGASGLASLIKMVLSLKNQKIPASLGFDEPNPYIEFVQSPFYLNDTYSDWNPSSSTRICGISSFGFSGTNCHIVLEEAPEIPYIPVQCRPTLHIFTLTAKTMDSLLMLVSRYRQFFEVSGLPDIGDICYTANTGRGHYNYRLAIMVSSTDELKKILFAIPEEKTEFARTIHELRQVYFKRHEIVLNNKEKDIGELYEEEKLKLTSEASAWMDAHEKNEADYTKTLPKICGLYVEGADIDWGRLYKRGSYQTVSLPFYPFDHKRYWAHTVTESRPATTAADVSVMMAHPLLDRCAVRTKGEGIYATAFCVNKHWVLYEHLIAGNHVIPGTTWLEMAAQAGMHYFGCPIAAIRNVQFYTPVVADAKTEKIVQIIIREKPEGAVFTVLSSSGENSREQNGQWVIHADGELILREEDPGITNHYEPWKGFDVLRSSLVAYGRDIGSQEDSLEYSNNGPMSLGPRWNCVKSVSVIGDEALVYLELPASFTGEAGEYILHPAILDVATSIGAGQAKEKDLYLPFSYKEIRIFKQIPARCYSYLRMLSDPGVKQEIMKFSIQILDEKGMVAVEIKEFSLKRAVNIGEKLRSPNPADNPYYGVKWVQEKLMSGNKMDTADDKGDILIFADVDGLGRGIAGTLENEGRRLVIVDKGRTCSRVNENKFTIGGQPEDYENLFRGLKQYHFTLILHMWTISDGKVVSDIKELDERQKDGVYSLFHIIRAMAKTKSGIDAQLILISDYVNEVNIKEKRICPENATLFGLGRVIGWEHPEMKCRCIDIDDQISAEEIVNEIKAGDRTYVTAYRGGTRYVETFDAISISKEEMQPAEIKSDGVYIITGGAGGIGLEVGKYIAGKCKVNMALLGRSEFPDRSLWDAFLEQGHNTVLCKKLEKLLEIEQMGSRVDIYKTDVANPDEMRKTMEILKGKYGRIYGVFHCAGVAGEGLVIRKDETEFEKVLRPKVQGTWLLDQLTENEELDFFVMFSSITSITGGTGRGDYTAANSYLDSFAAYRNRKLKRTLTINWAAWKETGMAVDSGTNKDGIFKALDTNDAINCMEELMGTHRSRIIVGRLNHGKETAVLKNQFLIKLSDEMKNSLATGAVKTGLQNVVKSPRHTVNVKLMGKKDGQYSDMERSLAGIWSDTMGLKEVSVYDDFYKLGGDSVLAIKITNDIRESIYTKANISDIFEYPSIFELAAYLHEKTGIDSHDGSHNRDKQMMDVSRTTMPYLELSSSQKRIWFLQKYSPDMTAYNLPIHFVVESGFNLAAFNKALNLLVDRHDILRTVFDEEAGIPRQHIIEMLEVNVELIDISDENLDDKKLEMLVNRENNWAFDMSKPLFVTKAYQFAFDKFCIFINFHHLITDGWSSGIFFNELLQAYEACKNGAEPVLQPLSLKYSDWVLHQYEWLKSEEAGVMEAYWLNMLSKPLPTLNLPTDYMRPQVKTYNGSYVTFSINNEDTLRFREVVEKHNTTFHMLFLSVYFLLLNKITGDMDIIIGIPIAGRENKQWENVMGLFMNTLCIRVDFSSIKTLSELLEFVKGRSLQAYKNSNYPFDLLVSKINPERDPSRSPVFSVMFQFYTNIPQVNEGISQFDISVLCKENDGGIEIRMEYNTDLFRKETIEQFLQYYIHILRQFIYNYNRCISEICVLDDEQKQRLLYKSGSIVKEDIGNQPVHRLFEQKAAQYPNGTALICSEKKLTYGELNQQANKLAHLLIKLGVKSNEPVGIVMGRGLNTIIGILGALKAGGAYVPVDPSYPAYRISYILRHCGIKILVTEGRILDKICEMVKGIENDIVKVVVDAAKWNLQAGKGYVYGSEDIQRQEGTNPASEVCIGDLMYIMYTSGSTGFPKGVMVTHQNAVNFLKWAIRDAELENNDEMMLVTSISFDISVFEIFGALLSGAALHVITEDLMMDSGLLLGYLEDTYVNIWHSVPAFIVQMLLLLRNRKNRGEMKSLKRIRRIMIGGEAWTVELAREIKETFDSAVLVNMYGPTEATIWVSSYPVHDTGQTNTLPIGKPISNNSILILDRDMQLCGYGIPGDIYIQGLNVTKGYYKDELKTNEVFLEGTGYGEVIYKTGDTGKYLPDGNIEFLGRKDGMVKIRGYRIEVGEIENTVMQSGKVGQAAVVAKKDAENNRLICFYTAVRNIPEDELREVIRARLPEYMIPSRFFRTDQIPLTPNGKIDRKALLDFDIGQEIREHDKHEAASVTEEAIKSIWRRLLGIERIGTSDNFFELGGDSFLVNKMHYEIELLYPDRIKISDIFSYPTVSKLSSYIDGKISGKAGKTESSVKGVDDILDLFMEIEKGNMTVDGAIKNLER